MAVDLLLGLQWGDEGKGKIVDVLTSNYNIIARFQGGPNAGHTLKFDGIKHVLRTIPSGIFHKDAMNVIGNGVVVDPVVFIKELEGLDQFDVDYKAKLIVSRKAHLILPTHRLLDAASEASKGKAKIGSTLKGIGPTYMDKTGRNGIRVGDLELDSWKEKYRALANKHEAMIAFYNVDVQYDLEEMEVEFFESIEKLKELQFIDSEAYLHQSLKDGKTILAEGAQGSLLDIDFGTYPFVTSSNTTAAGACTGLGIAPNQIKEVFGIFKAYTTRVGSETLKVATAYKYKGETIKHLPFNIEPENVEPIYTEFKGWSEDLTEMSEASQLPKALNDYIAFLEEELEIPIKIVSVGPDRKQTIFM